MTDVSHVEGPSGRPNQPDKKEGAQPDEAKFKEALRVPKITEVDPDEKKKRKRREEGEEELLQPPPEPGPSTLSSGAPPFLGEEEGGTRRGIKLGSSEGRPYTSIPTEPTPQTPPAFSEEDTYTYTESQPTSPSSKQPPTTKQPSPPSEKQKTSALSQAQQKEKKTDKTHKEEKKEELASLPPSPLSGAPSTPTSEKAKEKEKPDFLETLKTKTQEELPLQAAPEKEEKPPAKKEEEEKIAAPQALPLAKPLEGKKLTEKEEPKIALTAGPTAPSAPLEGAPVAPTQKAAAPTAFDRLPPAIQEIFTKMVGVMTVLNITPGVSESTFTLNNPKFTTSIFFGSQVTIKEFSTAPQTFNVQLSGSQQAVALFQANVDDLLAAFQAGKYNFRINRLETAHSSERPLFKRKEGIADKGQEDSGDSSK